MFYLMWQKKAYKRRGEGRGHPRTTPPPFGFALGERKKCGEMRMKMNSRGRDEKIEEERRSGWEGKGEEEHDGQEAMTEKDDVN